MRGAGVLMVSGAERWRLAALAPGVLASAAFLARGRPPHLQHVVWAALAATPLLALALAAFFTRGTGSPAGRLFEPAEWLGALPAIGFGLVAAGLLIFPGAAGGPGRGGVHVWGPVSAPPLCPRPWPGEAGPLWARRRPR